MVLFQIHLEIAGCGIPANKRRWRNACLMKRRLRRWPASIIKHIIHVCWLIKQWPWRPHRGRGLGIRFTWKNQVFQHGGDWEWSWPQAPKNVHNYLITVRKKSWAYDLVAEMLMILKNIFFDLVIQGQSSDMTVQRNVPRFCMGC